MHTSLYNILDGITNYIKFDLVDFSNKFKIQILNLLKSELNIEKNKKLNERIKKGCEYFRGKIDSNILHKLQSIFVECDNKSFLKSINKVLLNAECHLLVKLMCLKNYTDGFDVKGYLETKAKASIEIDSNSSNSKIKKADFKLTNVTDHPELFKRLKNWRPEKAEIINKPVYIVLHQKALVGIVEQLPFNLDKLKQVKGVGKRKLNNYGNEIIKIVSTYCNENSIDKNFLYKIKLPDKKITQNEKNKRMKHIL